MVLFSFGGTEMFFLSVVLLVLKLTVLPAISWWIVALPLLLVAGLWVITVVGAVIVAALVH
jgi:hypothetical protein